MTSEALPQTDKTCKVSSVPLRSVTLGEAKDLMAIANGILF